MPESPFDGLRICLLTDQDIASGLPLPADDWPCDPRPYLPEARWDVLTLEQEDAVPRLMDASREGYDVFFNLCDGAWDEARPGIEVVFALERLGVAFTGAHSGCYEPSREAMKRVCDALGIRAPAGIEIRSDEDVAWAAARLRYPLIVKHPSSYASAGLVPASRVETEADLWTQVARMRGLYQGALVEEFIDGDEYTVLVAENPDDPESPIAYQPLVYRFPEGESFKHEDLKWVHYDGLQAGPAPDAELDARLRDESARFFRGMNASGYGRCDVRVDREGTPWMLEINPNCGLFYPPTDPSSADLILQWDPAGHTGFVRTVVSAALARRGRNERPWRVGRRGRAGFETVATRPLRRGERILALTDRPQELVDRTRLTSVDDPDALMRLLSRSWPLTDSVWVLGPPDPLEWHPLTHSCEPNSEMRDGGLCASTEIAAGAALTVDFGRTFPGVAPDVPCTCGAVRCRGRVALPG
jgi:D-alanine-D-alanine ligase